MKNQNSRFVQKLTAAICAAAMTFTSAAAAPVIAADAQTDNYAKLLQYSLYFYEANMCGTQVDEKGAMTWRGDCHTSDGVDGGFHDAGDHAQFGLPAGYTASTMGWSYYEFKDAYEATGQTAHFRVIADHFAQFFKDSTTLSGDTVTNFVYQVGDGGADHAEWCAPEKQSAASRKVFRTNSGASDIAAEYAAALAVNYINFGNEEDLKYAKALYAFSTKYNRVATEGCYAFYPSSGCQDDQAWAAGWLYLATKDNTYKSACASKCGSIGWAHSWDNVMLGAQCVNAHITGNWNTVNGYLDGKCSGSSYLFMDAWGSARYNASMQLCALASTQAKESSRDYSAWCKGQMNYLLGQNPAGTCFVVGLGDNSAKYPHHRAASGCSGWGDMNGHDAYGSNGHVLVGALVGGPTTAGGAYNDSMQDYQANEVAIDYNAGLVGAAAGLYAIYQTGTIDDIANIPGVKAAAVTEPTTESTEATTETTEPTTEATEPTTEATEPSTEATEPSTESTEPTTEAAEPSTEATEPSTESTEPTTESTEPTTDAAEPTTESTEPTSEGSVDAETYDGGKAILMGDVNNDGSVGVIDVIIVQRWLHRSDKILLANRKAADLDRDSSINIFDLDLLKHILLSK